MALGTWWESDTWQQTPIVSSMSENPKYEEIIKDTWPTLGALAFHE